MVILHIFALRPNEHRQKLTYYNIFNNMMNYETEKYLKYYLI